MHLPPVNTQPTSVAMLTATTAVFRRTESVTRGVKLAKTHPRTWRD